MKFNKGDFIGRDVLLKVKEQGPERKLVGVELLDRGVCRVGHIIFANEHPIGSLTSGGPGPSVHKNIGMGYVVTAHAIVGHPVDVEIRGKRTAAQIVALPFYKRKK